MDISLNKTQQNITKEARRFLSKECPVDYVQEMFLDERGFSDEHWDKMSEMDWMAMRIPEEYGGMGMELIDICIVLEEMGRVVVPGPFFSTVLLAGELLIEAGSDQQKKKYLSGIADGKLHGTLALSEQESGSDFGYIQMEAKADGSDFVLNGTKLFVPDAHVSDFFVCAARTEAGENPENGITLFLLDTDTSGVTVSLLPSMDGTRKLSAIKFKNVRLSKDSILGDLNKGWGPLRRSIQRAMVGICAECVGGASRVTELSTEYSKERVQYDLPIGSYQAIKHMCADMFVDAESSRSLMYWAAWAQDHADEKEAAIAASVAKSYCTEAFRNVASNGIQVHGGTGFTWENEMHLFLKRAKANEAAFGDTVYHREKVIQLLTS
ncbi:MAG: acyl-CoA/acyl-ACP dehydrogenase [Deltaproteobacteria bacterium]|nr:acyl-CoA/acyl-ACP dehydrogenase [Deltaproteobacteria bacterium]